MRKTTLIVLILIQFLGITMFSTTGALIKNIEKTIHSETTAQQQQRILSVFKSFKSLQKIFDWGTIFLGCTLFASLLMLIREFRNRKTDITENQIPPLQNYLLELKTSEKKLLNSIEEHKERYSDQNELNQKIISNIDKGIIITDINNRIRLFNEEAQRIFKKSYAGVVNCEFHSVISDYPEIQKFITDNCNQKVVEQINSKERYFNIEIVPLKNTGALFFIKDVTDHKKSQEISRKNRTLISLGEMASFLAHEIRNSLGVIYGYTGTMSAETDKLQKINREIKFMTSMMENFLNFSSPVVPGNTENLNLQNILKESASNNNLKLIVNSDVEEVKSDLNILRSIFSNIFLNARQAEADKIEICMKKDGDFIEISLRDNGTGISRKNFDKIWLPFFSTKTKGSGMGLAIVKKHLNAVNSDIKIVESSENGSQFLISLHSFK